MTPLPDLPASPPPATAVTAAAPGGVAPAGAPPVSLPPPPSPPPAVATAEAVDGVLLLLVAALAFLLASFPARNSNVWRHLAAGRQLARGEFSFGAVAGALPVLRGNPTWLYDLLCYGVYSAAGGAGLVLFKALLVVALAGVLLRLCRTGPGWLPAVACTALALLAMSTRLGLQPLIVSYLFLALALLFEQRRGGAADRGLPPLLPPWPLAVLFVFWANLDGWFVLGLAAVGLVWLGRSLDEAAPADGPRRNPLPALLRRAAALAVLAAACLLNPSFVEAFRLPRELASVLDPASAAAAAGPEQVTSPFQEAYFKTLGRTPTGLAYFPLLGLSLLSFVLNYARLYWQRFLPWAGLALLSAAQAGAVPFFAVVAAPVLAWNLHSWAAGRAARGAGAAGLTPAGLRGLAVAVGLVLAVGAWPGWLQVPPFEPRRWSVEPPRSLELAAAAVRRWHEDGKLTADSRGLHMAADTLSAFAWYCPEDLGREDPQLTAAIRGELELDGPQRMRAEGIDHVIVYDPEPGRLYATLERLLLFPREWPLLYLEGDVAIFGWRDPGLPEDVDPFRDRRLDLHRLAFHPEGTKRAPREGAGREPEPRPWWQALYVPAPPRAPDEKEARLYLTYAEAVRQAAPERHLVLWDLSQEVATVGAAGHWGAGGVGPAAALLDARLYLARTDASAPDPGAGGRAAAGPARAVQDWQQRFVLQHDDAPPPLLYLAVRAARRALAANPDDVQAQLDLGESYMRLIRSTRERAWAERVGDLTQLRSVQASTALNRALALKPDLAEAHLRLYDLYRGMNYLDLGLDHLRAYVKLKKQTAPRGGPAAKAFNEELALYEEDMARLAKDVEDRENTYAVAAAAGGLVLDKARQAAQKGLARKARDMLLESDVSAFGAEGMKLELRLLLTTGRSRDVREWITPDDQARLGAPQYHWLQILSLAADGDYERVQEEFGAMSAALLQDIHLQSAGALRQEVAGLVAQAVLEERPGEGPVANLLRRALGRVNMYKKLPALSQQMVQQADMRVLGGLLSLEEGRTSEATFAFEEALKVWRDEAAAASGAGQDFGGRIIAQDCLKWLK
jgi:hypothetical protein